MNERGSKVPIAALVLKLSMEGRKVRNISPSHNISHVVARARSNPLPLQCTQVLVECR